ncbi:hypothetical protein [Candidatus Bathycorpusculum sp.]|uniref:hypothetical protein n=1 Tax=Candidatus Bathycorpusculum sp. TaxID=2994959 RepID=UPI0028288C57|nr:hypothetical protein [Candidatus Termitimicrobium sp.]MCL2686113.1 hypothetical protein [Candidatus Termitimicrobium sp.]
MGKIFVIQIIFIDGCKMAIEQFTVQATLPNVLIIVTVALIVSGIVLLGANRLLRNRLKDRQVYGKMIVGIGIGVNYRFPKLFR